MRSLASVCAVLVSSVCFADLAPPDRPQPPGGSVGDKTKPWRTRCEGFLSVARDELAKRKPQYARATISSGTYPAKGQVRQVQIVLPMLAGVAYVSEDVLRERGRPYVNWTEGNSSQGISFVRERGPLSAMITLLDSDRGDAAILMKAIDRCLVD